MSRTAVVAAFAVVAAGLGYLSVWRPLVDPPGPAPAPQQSAGSAASEQQGAGSVPPDVQRGYHLVRSAGGQRDVLVRAAQAFAQAAQVEPERAETWFGWGWALQLMGDERGAEAKYLRAAALAFDDPKLADTAYFTAYNLAVLYTRQRRDLEALGALERASTLRPAEPSAWAQKGRIFLGLGAGARAVAALEKAAALRDPSVAPDLARARALAR